LAPKTRNALTLNQDFPFQAERQDTPAHRRFQSRCRAKRLAGARRATKTDPVAASGHEFIFAPKEYFLLFGVSPGTALLDVFAEIGG